MNRHELLDEVFDALERHDLESVESWFERHAHPDVMFTSALTSGVEGRVYRGKRGLVNWANDISEAVSITYGAREYRDMGDDVVVVLVRPKLEGRGSGVQIQLEVGFVIEFEGELARRGASYPSHAEALGAANALTATSESTEMGSAQYHSKRGVASMSEGSPSRRVELVRAGQEALERSDRDAFRDVADRMMHRDGEWVPLLAEVEGGPYIGPRGVMRWFDDFMGSFEVRYENPEFVEVGDRVVLTLGEMRLRGRESDIEVTRDVGTVYEFDGERLRRGRVYDSRAEAIAAAEALGAADRSTDAESVG